MSASCDSRFARVIDSLAAPAAVPLADAGLAPRDWDDLRRHVAGCGACRERYDRTLLAVRVLEGGPSAALTQSTVEVDAIERAVLASAAAERAPEPSGWRRLWMGVQGWRLAGAAGAVLAAALL